MMLMQNRLNPLPNSPRRPKTIPKRRTTMIKLVVFDLDGTLADTLKDLGTAMNV